MVPLYQSDKRWGSLLLGHGPSTIGRAGCVLTALTMAARELGLRPDMLPPHANSACVIAGAFVGDEILVPKAALALGMMAEDSPTIGIPCDSAVLNHLDEVTRNGGMGVVRIDLNLDQKGDHTILAVNRNPDGSFDCLCPAVGRMQLGKDGVAVVSWGKDGLKKYRVVGVRGLKRPTQ